MSGRINIQLHGALRDFLRPRNTHAALETDCVKTRSVKDLFESLGVPHPEVDLVIVDGRSVDFDHLVYGGEMIEIYPPGFSPNIQNPLRLHPPITGEPCFVLDVHLGKLAAYLRLFGFDTLYRNDYDDPELANISAQQQRILLTRDIKLLMRKQVQLGYCVRERKPRRQLIELIQRYDLSQHRTGRVRCIECNGVIQSVAKDDIESRLQPLTRAYYEEFYQCEGCGKIYWKGSHYDHMERFRDRVEQQITG